IFFFFSSRRRHTRFSRDWSSDVCSSDLRVLVHAESRSVVRHPVEAEEAQEADLEVVGVPLLQAHHLAARDLPGHVGGTQVAEARSEERRVGKECRSRRTPNQRKKNKQQS